MKKITTLFTAAFLLVASVSFAKDPNPVPERIVNSLNADFENASGISWKTIDKYYKASFTVNGETFGAFYDFSGYLVATSRKLSIGALPMRLQKELKEIAPQIKVEDLFELLGENGTEYYIQFSDGEETKSYKSIDNSWTRI